MSTLPRACLGCGTTVRGKSRCPRCAKPKANTTARGYGAAWQKLREDVLQRDGWVCRYCGGAAKTVDHVIPKARGGTDDLRNLVAACLRCNSVKGARVSEQDAG